MSDSSQLWNEFEKDSIYVENKELYQAHILEQYKMYTEMADRISQRRNSTNVFFLSLSTSLITGLGFALANQDKYSYYIPILLACLGLVICIAWWWILRSYRNLNSAKFKVVGQLEERLPSSPYWSAEWKELGEGKSLKKYLPLSKLEQFVPLIFLIFYLCVFVKSLFDENFFKDII
ncbi:RipA family octameric membrane protein [Hyunsoonleella pacifica]|uniref:Uncharacterized protein n=1 Tax=Hyunsoonleella pacifica TaxID=1080224 RepID=A0A4Q9FU58_9FLAO|nr:hypothetical protein [Hyunsoonleella pacifica]TBN18839.1 hypothetical protein EYD46_01885 [Hyunsoonleella pacifica]GGD05221.1 membrane protein [Hyunsoonleella pacifica]